METHAPTAIGPFRRIGWTHRWAAVAVAALTGLGAAAPADARPRLRPLPPAPHHDLEVVVDVDAASIEVRDVITLDGALGPLEIAAHLEIVGTEPAAAVEDGAPASAGSVGTRLLRPPAGAERLEVHYRGTYDAASVDPRRRLADDARRALGTIGADGVFLGGTSAWVPMMAGRRMTFSLEVAGLPAGWHLISQGEG
ncbi:MAG: hypothetical protein AAFX50_12660, partial [Acidobacteriota bacterium]